MSDLTPDNAKPGVKVRCVRAWTEVVDNATAFWHRGRWVLPPPQRLVVGEVYTIAAYQSMNLIDCRNGEEVPYQGNEGGVKIVGLVFEDEVFWELDRFEVIDETESSVQAVASGGDEGGAEDATRRSPEEAAGDFSQPERRPSKPAYRPTRAASRRKIQRQGY